jgi:hypothetical protein
MRRLNLWREANVRNGANCRQHAHFREDAYFQGDALSGLDAQQQAALDSVQGLDTPEVSSFANARYHAEVNIADSYDKLVHGF